MTNNDDFDTMSTSVFDDGDDALDVVLDDRTARAYNLDSMGDSFGFDRTSAILDEDDDLMIDDSSASNIDDDDEEEDDDDGFDDDDI